MKLIQGSPISPASRDIRLLREAMPLPDWAPRMIDLEYLLGEPGPYTHPAAESGMSSSAR